MKANLRDGLGSGGSGLAGGAGGWAAIGWVVAPSAHADEPTQDAGRGSGSAPGAGSGPPAWAGSGSGA